VARRTGEDHEVGGNRHRDHLSQSVNRVQKSRHCSGITIDGPCKSRRHSIVGFLLNLTFGSRGQDHGQ
jgi:hypothetical protein